MYRSSIARGSSRQAIWLAALLVLFACGALTACDAVPTTAHTATATAETSVPTAQATATMPILTSEVGWHTVLAMDSSKATQSIQQSFVASKPYVIFYACEGSGKITVSYGQITEVTTCTSTPNLNGTSTLQPTHRGENVTIGVATSGDITWELLVSIQN